MPEEACAGGGGDPTCPVCGEVTVSRDDQHEVNYEWNTAELPLRDVVLSVPAR